MHLANPDLMQGRTSHARCAGTFASFRTDRGLGRSPVRAAHRMTVLVLAASVLALRAASIAAGAPSFDCTKARTPDEKAICADPALSELDAQLGVIYRRTMQRSNPDEAAALRATQCAGSRIVLAIAAPIARACGHR